LPGIHYKTILQTDVIPFHRQNYWSRWFADGAELFQVRFIYKCHNIYHSTFMRGTQNLPTDPEQSWLFSKVYED